MNSNLQVKICGIKTVEATQVAVENGAAMLGLVFYPPSPRFLTREIADELVAGIAGLSRRPALVGLFVNSGIAELSVAVERFGLDYLQLSGDETPSQVQEAARLRPVIKVLRPADDQVALEEAARFAALPQVTLLLDSHKKGMYGGTGQVGDWSLARHLAAHYPLMLAGGLTPENVGEAVRQVQPWGVDVSSGVEKDGQPGQKDLTKIRQFCLSALESAAALPQTGPA